MKRIITLTSVLFLFLMTTFASADSLVKKVQLTDPTELTGTITYLDLEGGQYLLQNERGKYALLGKNSEVRNSLGKKVHLTGKMVNVEVTFYQRGNGFFQIDTLEVIGAGEEYAVPEKPIIKEPIIKEPVIEEPIIKEPLKEPELGNPTQVEGQLIVDYIEGKHYELVTNNGSFVITGNTSGMEKYINQHIKAKGAFTVNAITIWQKGEVFVVEEWAVREDFIPEDTITEPEEIVVITQSEPKTVEEDKVTTEDKATTTATEETVTISKVTAKELEDELVKQIYPTKTTLVEEPENSFQRNLPTIPKPPVEVMSEPVVTDEESEILFKAAETEIFSFSVLYVSHFSAKNEEPVRFTIK